MLTSDLVSPAAVMLIVRANTLTDQSTAEATISCCFNLLGSYCFSSFHIRRTMAATCRAIVSLARLGLVPAELNCRCTRSPDDAAPSGLQIPFETRLFWLDRGNGCPYVQVRASVLGGGAARDSVRKT